MEIAIIKNGVITTGDYKTLFPNTSFSASGPSDSFLTEHSAKKLNRFKSHDRLTQKLVSCDAYDDGEFVSVVRVVSLTSDEIQSAKDSAMAGIRNQRDRLLASCDWTQLPDAPSDMKSEWATYRQALRDFPATLTDARQSVTWPTPPNTAE